MSDFSNSKEMSNSSKAYSLFYAFFLIPLMIAIFGALFVSLWTMMTKEEENPYLILNNINSGSTTKRWQSAFELTTIMADPLKVPEDDLFINQ